MGVSTDGQLCYGIPFPEGFELPWGDVSEDEWWREINGYKPPFMLYTEDGKDYLSGVKPPEALIDQYYEHQHEWDKANPFPVEIVNYCSGESPMYMVAVKESVKKNSRGYAQEINPSELTVTDEQKQVLLDFIEKYMTEKIEEHNEDEYNEKVELEPKWYLTSYWG